MKQTTTPDQDSEEMQNEQVEREMQQTAPCHSPVDIPKDSSLNADQSSKAALPGQVGVSILKIVRYALTGEPDKVRRYTEFLAEQLQDAAPELAEGLRLYAVQDFGRELRPTTQTTSGSEPSPVVPDNSLTEAATIPEFRAMLSEDDGEITRLKQSLGWVLDAADAAYIEDENNERIHEIFNIVAKACGITRRLPDDKHPLEL